MRIEAARYSAGELHLVCDSREGIQLSYQLKPGDYDIVPHREKRSLNANSYAWVLIHKIASVLNLPPLEVYKRAVENTAGNIAEQICIKEIAAPDFIKSWEKGHLGRMVQQYPSDTPGYVILTCIYGSSDYDKQQMSRLIDGLVQDAKELNIETMQPEKLESLLNAWN